MGLMKWLYTERMEGRPHAAACRRNEETLKTRKDKENGEEDKVSGNLKEEG